MNNESKPRTVYLAGKITGDPNYREKFNATAAKLEAAGFTVLNPAVLPPKGLTYSDYMRISSAMLDVCDGVCFLPDWKDSHGAMYEYGRAASRNKQIFFYEEWESDPLDFDERGALYKFYCELFREEETSAGNSQPKAGAENE